MEPQIPVQSRAQVDQFRRKHLTELVTLLFTDIVGSGKIKAELGDQQGLVLIRAHHAIVRDLLTQFPDAQEVGTAGDSFFIIFARPSEGVKFALMLQARMKAQGKVTGRHVSDRVGIHVGEVFVESKGAEKPRDLFGLQVDVAARVMALAGPDQILVTRFGFDNARQVLKGEDIEGVGPLSWMSHGSYWFKDVDEMVEICEVAPAKSGGFRPPNDTNKAKRVGTESELVPGWRPALGQEVPDTNWILEEKLGEGGFGEVWLGHNQQLHEQRVFKFCFQADRVRSLKREVALFRLIKERSGEHSNIVRLYDVCLEQPPYYLVEEYVEGRDLQRWVEQQGGIQQVPLETRLEIVAQAAEALQAAHEAGIVHRDVKPSNILIQNSTKSGSAGGETGSAAAPAKDSPVVKLTDFGIAQVVLTEDMPSARHDLPRTLWLPSMEQTGTQLYQAPELLAGKPASTRSDLYALGVVFYQLLVADFQKPVTTEWPEDVTDPLLRDDLKHCFAGNPRDRFAGTGQLAERIRSLEQRRRTLIEQQETLAARERAAFRQGILRTGAIASLVVLVILALTWQVFSNAQAKYRQAAQIRSTTVRLTVANGTAALNQGDWLSAALWYSEAFLLDDGFHAGALSETSSQTHRARINSLLRKSPAIVQMWFDQGNWCGGVDQTAQTLLLGDTNGYRLYSITTGKAVSPLVGQRAARASLRPDGQRIVTGGGTDRALFTVWEAASGIRLFDLQDRGGDGPARGDCRDLQFSPDGRWIAALLSIADSRVLVWDANNGKVAGVVDYAKVASVGWTNGDIIFSARFDTSGRRLVTTSADHKAIVWDWQSGLPQRILPRHESWVYSACFGHIHTNWLVTCGFDRKARLWDLDTGEELVRMAHEGDAIQEVQLSYDDRWILTAGLDSTVRFWDAQTGRMVPPILRDHTRVMQVLWCPGDKAVISVSWDGVTRVWRLSQAQSVTQPVGVDYSDDGRYALSCEQGSVHIQDASSGQELASFRVTDSTNAYCCFNGGSECLLCFSQPGPNRATQALTKAQLWQVATKSPVGAPIVYDPAWSHVVAAPGGQRTVFFADPDHGAQSLGVFAWDPAKSSTPDLISFSNEVVTAAAFDPLGRRLALASTLRLPGGAAIRVIDLESNSTTLLQPRSRQPISEVTFSPNGQWLAAAFWDDTLAPGCAEIWRVADGGSSFSEAGVLDHLDGVLSVAFSGSSELIATASEDQTANVWSRTNETWQFSLRPFYCGGEVYACAFSHNGRWLATANRTPKAQGAKRWSSEIRIWDVVNSEPVGLPIAIYDRVTRLVFLGNGGRLFVERWQPPAAPERWIVDLVSQNDRGAHKGLTQEFLLQTELLSAQRSFLSGRTPHLSRALEGSISAEEAMSRATSVGQLRPLSKEDCRELWHHLSSARLPTGTGQSE